MKKILINIKSGYDNELFGKDLFETDAPDSVLSDATIYVEQLEEGLCAEDEFCKYVKMQGFKISGICELSDIPMYVASNENF